MEGLRRRLLSPVRRAAAGSVAAALAIQAALVVSGILSARLLGPEDRGYLALLLLVPSTIAQVGSLGLSLSLSYFIARGRNQAVAVVRTVARPVLLQVVILTIVHAGVVVFLIAGKPALFVITAIASLGSVPAIFAVEYGLAVLQGCQQYRTFNVLRAAGAILYSGLLVMVALASVENLLIVFLASLASTIAMGVVALALARRAVAALSPKGFDKTRRTVIEFGLRSYLGYISPVQGFRLDQLVVASLFSGATLGIYAVATSFTNLARSLGESLGLMASPHVASLRSAAAQVRASWRFFALSTALCGAVNAVLIVAMPELVPFLFGAEFAGATTVAQILLVGAAFIGMRATLTAAARGCGFPTLGSVAELVALVSFILAVVAFVGGLESRGVALAFSISAALGLSVLVVGFAAQAARRLARRGRGELADDTNV